MRIEFRTHLDTFAVGIAVCKTDDDEVPMSDGGRVFIERGHTIIQLTFAVWSVAIKLP